VVIRITDPYRDTGNLVRRALAEICTVPVLLVYTRVQPIPTVALEMFTGPRSSCYSSSNVEAQPKIAKTQKYLV